jgi:uncharacterized protein (DUF924 family)
METIETINAFWFGSRADDKSAADERASLWWSKNPAVDDNIRQRFASCTTQAAHGELDAWMASPSGRLALILLTDQFPRNMYRDTPKAFAYDHLANAWCKEGVLFGADRALRPIERVFFYLPLEHAESMDDQDRAVGLFEELAAQAQPEHKESFDGFLDFAVRHRDVIRRFGRFPHRNRILGRESTEEERAFLQQKASSF